MSKKTTKKTAIPLTAETLDIQKTKDKKVLGARHRGKKFGLSVTDFICRLFEINENLPRLKKMTDAEIRRQIIVEYAHYPKTVDYYKSSSVSISDARQQYNRGTWKRKMPPKYLSYRYDNDGHKTWGSRNSRMKEETILKYRARYTAAFMESPGKFCEGVEPQEWMLPVDNPLVVDMLKKRLKANEVRQKAKRENRNA